LSGLARLANQTGDNTLLAVADGIISHVLNSDCLMYPSTGILRENCENDSVNGCNTDQKIFKGIFTRHLVYFYLALGESERVSRTETVLNFIDTNSNSTWYNNRVTDLNGYVVFGPQWNKYIEEDSSVECVSDVSAFSLFNAALNLETF
jgi:predicted alpha-1,6-mannanase (GH76 family)